MTETFPPEIRAYTPICLCGSGAYGDVWLVADAVGMHCALKIVRKSSLGGDWQREFKGLRTYQTQRSLHLHPNLIQIHHIEDCGDFFYYTMECADNLSDERNYIPSTLENWVKLWGSLDATTLVPLFDQLLDGIEALHRAGLIHRDIKPDNIIFVKNVPKLSDIGLVSSASRTLSLAGTQSYVPPELLTGEDKELKQSVDIYALGKTLYRVFSGNPPDNFPFVPHKQLANEGGKMLNRLATQACDSRPFCRLKTTAEFRSILHGDFGWRYDVKSCAAILLQLIVSPLRWLLRGLLWCWKNLWIRTIVVLLLTLWLVSSCAAYQRMDSQKRPYDYSIKFNPTLFWKAMKQTILFHFPGIPKYDLYDFYEKNESTVKRYGERWLVERAEYMKNKYPGLDSQRSSWAIDIGEKMETGLNVVADQKPSPWDKDLEHRLLSKEFSFGLKRNHWIMPPEATWEEGTLTLPLPESQVDLIPELPPQYELTFSLLPEKFQGRFELVINAMEYPDLDVENKENMPRIKPQLSFSMQFNGRQITFAPGRYRPMNTDDDKVQLVGRPLISYAKQEKQSYEMKVVAIGRAIRCYLDGHLVLETNRPFWSGKLSLRAVADGNFPLKLNGFSGSELTWSNGKPGTFKLPEASQKSAALIIRNEHWRSLLPNYGQKSRKIMNDDWYGVADSAGVIASKDSLVLPAGKISLIHLRKYDQNNPCRFTVSMNDAENILKLKALAIKKQGSNTTFKLLGGFFSIPDNNKSSLPGDVLDNTVMIRPGELTLKSKIKAKKTLTRSLWTLGDMTYLFWFQAELKTPITINFVSSTRSDR